MAQQVIIWHNKSPAALRKEIASKATAAALTAMPRPSLRELQAGAHVAEEVVNVPHGLVFERRKAVAS